MNVSPSHPGEPQNGSGQARTQHTDLPFDALGALPDPVAVFDPQGTVNRVNRAWMHLEQAYAEQLPARPGETRLLEQLQPRHPDSQQPAQSLRKTIRDVLAGRTHASRGLVYLAVTRSPGRWFEARIDAFACGEGRHAVLSLIDVTESRHDRERLLDSESRFRLIAENSTDWITRHAPDATYLWVSPACHEMLGYEPDELVGRNPYDFFHPEDRPAVERSHQRILSHPQTSVVEYRFRCADGSYRWLETTSRAITDPQTGELAELQCASRDITHRKQTQTMLQLIRAAIEQVHDAVVITEPELDPPGPRIVYVNHAFVEMTGYEQSEVIGQTPRILQGPLTNRKVLDRLRRDLQQRGVFHGMTTNYRKNGQSYAVEWTITAVRDASGKLINWVSIQRDITERLRAEAAQQELQNQLAHVGRLTTLGELASGLAHELNQPLAAISNFAHGVERRIASGGIDPADLGNAIEHIAAQSDRAGEIVQRLRGFVRKREPTLTPEPLPELIDDVRALLTHEIQQSDAELMTDFDPSLPPVLADRVQIEQVLINIVRNAIEASQSAAHASTTPPRVEIRASARAPHVHIEITDRGPGLEPQEIERIFDPFFSTKEEGMGMGLTICHSIVQLHGGQLWAEANRDGPGLTFHLQLLSRG